MKRFVIIFLLLFSTALFIKCTEQAIESEFTEQSIDPNETGEPDPPPPDPDPCPPTGC